AQRDVADLKDRAALRALADEDVARLAPQPRAAALRAGARGAVARELLAHGDAVGLAPAALEVAHHALEGVLLAHAPPGALAAVQRVLEADLLLARAEQQHLAHRLWQFLPGRVGVEAVVRAQAFDEREVVAVAPVPALDGAAGQAQRGEGDDAH